MITLMPVQDFIEPIRSSRTLARVFGLALLVGLYAVIPTLKEFSQFRDWGDTSSQYHAVLSLILGWLLVFRTNTAYSRWWEARTLWGALVNASRNAAVKFTTLGDFSSHELERAHRRFRSPFGDTCGAKLNRSWILGSPR